MATPPSRLGHIDNPMVVDLENYTKVTLSLSTTSAKTAALTEGWYDVECDVDCSIAVGPEASITAAVATNYPLPAAKRLVMYVRADHAVAGIVASGTGTLTLHKVR